MATVHRYMVCLTETELIVLQMGLRALDDGQPIDKTQEIAHDLLKRFQELEKTALGAEHAAQGTAQAPDPHREHQAHAVDAMGAEEPEHPEAPDAGAGRGN